MRKIKDNFQRTIDYLRISLTDRCNLRCIYCMPPEGVRLIEHKEILSYEEIIRILRIATGIGVKKVRKTGGEPLARKNIIHLISEISNIDGIRDLSLTTNGILLSRYADKLVEAGLERINISLDSLQPDRFKEITRGGELNLVMKGIESAEKAGLTPIKVNMVPIHGLNSDEIEDFAKLTLQLPYQIRF